MIDIDPLRSIASVGDSSDLRHALMALSNRDQSILIHLKEKLLLKAQARSLMPPSRKMRRLITATPAMEENGLNESILLAGVAYMLEHNVKCEIEVSDTQLR